MDIGNRVVKVRELGLPQSNRDTFAKLEKEGLIPPELSESMKSMAGFRNLAVHDYSSVNIKVVVNIVENYLKDLIAFSD